MTAKNNILINFDKNQALAFQIKRKSNEAKIGYYENYETVLEKTVDIAIADRLYVKAMRNGFEVGF